MTDRRFIGLLGGTFDPVHYGHLYPAQRLKQQLGLDEVRLLPCHLPVHRDTPTASAEQRLAMLELALEEFPELTLDTRELARHQPSRSLDSLNELRTELPQAHFCWILGYDAFQLFDTWYQWRQVLSLTNLVIIHRPGYAAGLSDTLLEVLARHQVTDEQALHRSPAAAILVLEVDAPNISSSTIRQRLLESKPIDEMLPAAVIDWLNKNPVYIDKVK